MRRFSVITFALFVTYAAPGQKSSPAGTGITMMGRGTESCPVFVVGVMARSPAEQAGIKSGDVLVAIDGKRVASLEGADELLRSDGETSVTLQLVRGAKLYTAAVGRENLAALYKTSGQKILGSGIIVPLDATETEMKDKMNSLLNQDRFVDRVFPAHYPTNEKLYYAGFEVLVLKNPSQVIVLGIEDGPASRAGVHWGDTVLSVNGVDPREKSVAELERLFSSEKPATMTLKIERGGLTKTYVIELAQTAQVLRDNGKVLVHGDPIPTGIPEKYLSCFSD